MDEETRRNTLHNYMRTEPTLPIQWETYLISVSFTDEGPMFYAIHSYMHNRGERVLVPQETWEECHCGMSLAYLYGQVLDLLELLLVKSGGRQID